MATRPNINARDASGKQVSLLNDEPTPQPIGLPYRPSNYDYPSHTDDLMRRYSNTSGPSIHSSPRTPSLQRSDSYDSNITNDPMSPRTPQAFGEPGRPAWYMNTGYGNEQYDHQSYDWHSQRPYMPVQLLQTPGPPPLHFAYDRRQSSASIDHIHRPYDPDHMNGGSTGCSKRYPCRFAESNGCEKTFTTSGHASRHSKIHTAEKAVNCTFPGCSKKFTRADNMKQHLETHNKSSKDRSRPQGSSKPSSMLTRPAGVQRPFSRPSSSTGSRRAENPPYYAEYEHDRYPMHATHSPVRSSAPSNSGLDALANVAASQDPSISASIP